MKVDFGEVLTAMVTPFKEDGVVDYDRAEELAVWLAENGSDGLVVHGTTGESPTLTHEEEYELYRVVKKAVGSKAKVIAGTGSNSTATSIVSSLEAERVGVDGCMLVVPYYNKPSQEGLFQHFKAVSEATPLPLIIYNIPGRTAVNLLPETVARIAELENVVAIKEATGDLNQVLKIRKLTGADFLIYSGDDSLTLPILASGGTGIISVASHLVGGEIKKMVGLFKKGKVSEALEINLKLMPLFSVLFITTNPVPVKAALELVGRPVGKPRLPLVEATNSEKEAIKKVLQELNLLK
jgi:4-hydroxy-tetrahydrodipicolinate synthase